MASTLLNDPFSQSKDRYFFGNRILIHCLIIVPLQYFPPAFLLSKSMPIHSFSLSLGYKQASKWWWWCPPWEQVGDLHTFILPPLLQIWCFILVPRSIVEYLIWPLLPLCPHFQVTKQILVTYPVFLPLVKPRTLPLSRSPPLLSVNSQYQEVHSIQNIQWWHMTASQSHSLLSNPEVPHSLKN